MAAVAITLGVLAAVMTVLFGLMADRANRLAMELEIERRKVEHQPLLSDQLTQRLIERLMDASLPERRDTPEPEGVGSPGEYEPPPPTIGDWTDPFIGVDRELVGGLRPGEGIPGIGPDAGEVVAGYDIPDDIEEFYAGHPQERGFEAVGDDLFETWDANRGEMPR